VVVLCRNKKAGKDSNGAYPTYRLTGLLLNFEFKYYNYKNVRAPRQFCKAVRTIGVLSMKPADSEHSEQRRLAMVVLYLVQLLG
jgi:hypothetical protein